MRALRIGVLSAFVACGLLGSGLVPLGCCDSVCSACPTSFCKETPQVALSKSFVAVLVPVALSPALTPSRVFSLAPRSRDPHFDFAGFRPPLRN